MECWYDSLFECDCAGIAALTSVPCAGTDTWVVLSRSPRYFTLPMINVNNKSLAKRIFWITNCASVVGCYVIGFDDWKTKKWKVFVEVFSVAEWGLFWHVPGVGTVLELAPESIQRLFATQFMDYRVKELKPHSCYYLGQYPWHWDYEMCRPLPPGPGGFEWEPPKNIRDLTSAKEPWTGVMPHLGPYEGTPGIPGVTGVTLENLDEEELVFYHGKLKTANFLAQVYFQEWLDTRLKNCIAKHYPPAGWKPTQKVNDMDWPGKPIRELDQPTPMGPRAKPPGIEQTTTNVTMSMYFSPPGREDGLTLDLEIT